MLNFFQEIAEARNHALRGKTASKLKEQISKEDLCAIYDFLFLGANTCDLVNVTLPPALKEKRGGSSDLELNARKFVNKIRNLSPQNPAVHLPKEMTGLNRTFEIIRRQDGVLMLNLSTNNKLRDHTPAIPSKQALPKKRGNFKEGRAAAWQLVPQQKLLFKFVLDAKKIFDLAEEDARDILESEQQQAKKRYLKAVNDPNIEKKQAVKKYFSEIKAAEQKYQNKIAQRKLGSKIIKEEFDSAREEANMSHVNSEFVQQVFAGEIYIKNGLEKLALYTDCAPHGNLKEFLKRINIDKKFLTLEEKNILILNILEGVKALHDLNIKHQDLKPENTLVMANNVCTITDLGLATNENKASTGGTLKYMSGEELYFIQQDQSKPSWQKHFNKLKSTDCLGKSLLENVDPAKLWGAPEQYEYAQKQNDIWAIGIIAFEILFGRYPQYDDLQKILADKSNHPLLSAALEPDPTLRANIDELIAIHKIQMRMDAVKRADPPVRRAPVRVN